MSNPFKDVSEAIRAAAGSLKNRRTCAIIVAAGSGTRMGTDKPKQFLELSGMPVVVHALRAYQSSDYITDIVVVRRAEDASVYDDLKEKFGITKLLCAVTGGNSRQQSVLNGIEAVPSGTAYVAIADAARPLTSAKTIDEVCLAAYRYGAATAAYPSADTVKTSEKGFISSTVERSSVMLAATPQVFALNVYRAAAYSCLEEGFAGTDDNSLCEHIGISVKLVECPRTNIKITEPSDLLIAEALISSRAEIRGSEGEEQ